jgi:Interferon-induced transmembrane protein
VSDYPPPPPPGYGGYGTPYGQPANPPSNFLVPAILSTIFCCLPFGIAAIVYAAQVNGKWQAGDFAGAQQAARRARTFTYVSVVLGLVGGVIYGIIVLSTGQSTR